MGWWLYLVLFVVVFCETGLVVTPFLPGDSLLFACGALAATAGSPLDLWVLVPLLWAAAVLGDFCNYEIGKWFGPKVFTRKNSRSFNVVGAALWVALFVFGGYFFADLPMVQKHFHYVLVAIIVLSCLPAVFEFWNERRKARQAK